MGRLSPHRQTEAALPESAQRADVPLDAELDCVIAMDSDGRVLKLNSAAEQTFGYSHDEVVGQPLADLIIPPELRAAHWAGLARFLETGDGPVIGKRLETMAMRSDQSTFLVDLIIYSGCHG
jgi:PAS domain S-box-containing protein